MVLALVHRDGRLWMRQLFDDRTLRAWVHWENAPPFGLEKIRFTRRPHATLRRFSQSQISQELRLTVSRERRLSQAADKRGTFGPVWVRGDEKTMRQWISWAAQVFVEFDRNTELKVGHSADVAYHVHAGSIGFAPWVPVTYRGTSRPVPPLLRRLWQLILREQRVYALASTHTSYRQLEGFTRFLVRIPAILSQHERLEAMLRLREAVRGTRIEAEVEKILEQAVVG